MDDDDHDDDDHDDDDDRTKIEGRPTNYANYTAVWNDYFGPRTTTTLDPQSKTLAPISA